MRKGRAADERNGTRTFYGVSFCRNIDERKVGDRKGKGGEKVKNFVNFITQRCVENVLVLVGND